MNLVPAIILWASGVIVAAAAFLHRNDPAWDRNMVWIIGIAIAQVGFGVIAMLLLR